MGLNARLDTSKRLMREGCSFFKEALREAYSAFQSNTGLMPV
ncbi:hypothetical protein ATN83_p20089 (plasmid) [Raoultella ornithinolytica]|nr:hypothetical protein ATN83_p20089 [Raoultella ornithinolytica]